MARAKEAVETFLELGAKYEVVLVGLATDVQRQENRILDVENRTDLVAKRVEQIAQDVSTAVNDARTTAQLAGGLLNDVKEVAALSRAIQDDVAQSIAAFRTELESSRNLAEASSRRQSLQFRICILLIGIALAMSGVAMIL